MGPRDRRSREKEELKDQDPRRRARAVRRRGLRARHHAQDRRAHRVLADRDLSPLPRQDGGDARALRPRLSDPRQAVPEDRARSPTRSSACARWAAPTRPSRLVAPQPLPADVHDPAPRRQQGRRQRRRARQPRGRRLRLPEVDRGRRHRLGTPAARVPGRRRARADVVGGRARRGLALHREVRGRLGASGGRRRRPPRR